MEYVFTDGKNQDFIALCQKLDEYLNQVVGGEKQQKKYAQYNTLSDIHDVIVVYDDKTPVACGSLKQYNEKEAEIKRVFVKEEYRGSGIAKQLMDLLEEKARELGYSNLILETGKIMTAANRFYKKIGFEIIENYGQYKDIKESVCMRKSL